MMKRELSVEDLFGPLNRLDVRHPCDSTEVEPLLSSRVTDVRSEVAAEAEFGVPLLDFHRTHPVSLDHDRGSSSAARLSSACFLDMAPIPEETGVISHTPMLGLTIGDNPEEGNSAEAASSKDHVRTSKGSSTMFKSNFNVSDGLCLHMQGNSTSDEDQHVLDDRKQRRMLSNRESARRSRLRKQQHLDELRGHVAQLRAQKNQMLNSFNLASQQFSQVTEENQKLRSEAMDLSHQLQHLHHTVTSQRANNNGLLHGGDVMQTGLVRQTVQGPSTSTSSFLVIDGS